MVEDLNWFDNEGDENIVWSGQPHINSIYPSVALGIILIPLAGLGLLIILMAYLDRENKDFVITNEGVYRKSGIISRRVKKISFGKIQDTSYNQGYFGRMFNYGNVDITTAGGSQVEMRFQSIPNPEKVQKKINQFIKGDESSSERSEKDLLREILQELKTLNRKMQ